MTRREWLTRTANGFGGLALAALLQEQARALGISDSVLFRPAVAHANINLVYSAADIQLSMSEHEPFGLTALEAMACGTPVVATKNGGPSSFITHNVTGSLVDVQNPSRIASYVLTLLKDATFYTNMQESARKFVHEHFSWSSRAEHFAQAYAQALKPQTLTFSEWLKTHYIAQTLIAKR